MGLDPRFVETYLDHFHEFNASQDIESKYICWDLGVALWNAPLTVQERSTIQRLYLDPPKPPVRTDKPGRPAGGPMAHDVKEKSTISNLKRSAITKIAQFLGDSYGLED